MISNQSSEFNPVITEAVVRTGRRLRHVTDSQHAFELLRTSLFGIDFVIIDLDPGIHSMAILEALSARDCPPPIIVITGFEEYDMTPIAHRHGATACIAKPFTAAELEKLIDEVCPAIKPPDWCSSDRWGHPHRHPKYILRRCAGGQKT